MQTKRWRVCLLVILGYTLLALALTWPLAAHLGRYVPGDGIDDPPLTWNLWWIQHALLQEGTNPFDCEYLFYPLGINLAFYTLTVLNGLLSIPLQAAAGLVPASNLLLLSSFVLGGYGTFLLASYLLEKGNTLPTAAHRPVRPVLVPLAAFLSGMLYAFSSSKLFYAALGQWNIASSQWIPFYVLYLFMTGDHPRRWRYPLLAALFLLFQAYAELTYASFLALFTALWLVWRIVLRVAMPRAREAASRRRPRELVGRSMLNLILVGGIAAVGLIPILLAMWPDLRTEGDIFGTGGGFADVFSADLVGFLIPTMHHPLFGALVKHFDFPHTVGQHLYLGYSVLALAMVGIVCCWRRPAVRFWLVSALLFWLLTLGPTLRVNGHDTGLPLPFSLVASLPFFKGNRYPSRYGVLLVLSLAILIAFGLLWLLDRVARLRMRTARPNQLFAACYMLLAALLLFEHLSAPLPLSDMRVLPVYEAIATNMPGDFALLDLPVAWRNGSRVTGTQDPIIMFEQYYQSAHGKRILAGNTSRNPPLKFQYFTEAPLINTLIALETGHQVDPTVVQADRAVATDVLRFFDIAAIVVHPEQAGPQMLPYVESTMPVERFFQDGQTAAYRVDLPPWPERWTIQPGDAMSRLSYAEGWGLPAFGVIWAQRRAVRLLVPLNGQAQYLAFRAYAPPEGQKLWVEANGQIVARIDMIAGWGEYTATLAAGVVREGLNEVWLHFDALYPASHVRLSSRTITSASQADQGVQSPVNLVVWSAGQEVGDFGHIYVDGREVSPNQRGYNVAVVHPQSGQVERAAAFDTHLDEGASRALATYLRDVPPGHIVAVAAADEASRLLDQEAVDALRGLGATGDLRGKFRWGHALIGVQGAPPGAALEAMDWMRPVAVVSGEGASEPYLAAGFGTFIFRAVGRP